MAGHVIPNTPIAVDFWQVRKCPSAKLFFLTHVHSDHTCGLSSTWRDKIYTSNVSGKLLIRKFKINPSLIIPLEIGNNYVIDLDENGIETMSVKVIDANHCPGSVMYLFEGYFGVILYTGDFRYYPNIEADLHISKPIDILYLDNTYCHPSFSFPTREVAKKELFNKIEHFKNYNIKLGMFGLGKENLLVDLAHHFKTWIVVSPEYYEKLQIFQLPNVFSTDATAGRISVVDRYKVTPNFINNCNQEYPTVGIIPSAFTNNCWDQTNIFFVPYSDHSSFAELCTFVQLVNPREIVPIVSNNNKKFRSTEVTSYFKNFINPFPKEIVVTPDSVKKFMRYSNFNCLVKKFCKKSHLNFTHKNSKVSGIVYDSPSKQFDKLSIVENTNQQWDMVNEIQMKVEYNDNKLQKKANTVTITELNNYVNQMNGEKVICKESSNIQILISNTVYNELKTKPAIQAGSNDLCKPHLFSNTSQEPSSLKQNQVYSVKPINTKEERNAATSLNKHTKILTNKSFNRHNKKRKLSDLSTNNSFNEYNNKKHKFLDKFCRQNKSESNHCSTSKMTSSIAIDNSLSKPIISNFLVVNTCGTNTDEANANIVENFENVQTNDDKKLFSTARTNETDSLSNLNTFNEKSLFQKWKEICKVFERFYELSK